MISTEKRVALAVRHARRYYRRLVEEYGEDVVQEAWLLVLSRERKHDTVRETQRIAGRHFYRVSKAYGLQRMYVSGNRKTALQPMEEQLYEPQRVC